MILAEFDSISAYHYCNIINIIMKSNSIREWELLRARGQKKSQPHDRSEVINK